MDLRRSALEEIMISLIPLVRFVARDQRIVSGKPGLSRALADARSEEFGAPAWRCGFRSLARPGEFL